MQNSADARKSVKVPTPVKNKLEEFKEKYGSKSEAEVIAYLLSFHEEAYARITLPQHAIYQKRAKELLDQT